MRIVPYGANRSNAKFDESTGRLINTPCTFCAHEHLTRQGFPSCRGHRAWSLGTDDPLPCRANPPAGQSTCPFHWGDTPQVKRKAKQRLALAAIRTEVKSLGGQLEVDETEAMLTMVREAAWNVACYRSLLEDLKPEASIELDLLGSPIGAATFASRVKLDDLTAQPHVLIKMYNDERDRLMKYSKMCHDAGIAERRTHIAEEQGAWLVRTIDMVLTELNLTPDQTMQLPMIMGKVIDELERSEEFAPIEVTEAGT